MGTFQQDMDALGDRASKGDVKAGIKMIMGLVAAGTFAGGAFYAVLAAKAAIVAVAPWSAPFIAPAMLAMLTRQIIAAWADLDTDQRRLVGIALKWLTGGLHPY